jgi:regulator of sigma E protease
MHLIASIALAIVALALLIVLHEGGHFLVARLCGMRVERFSIGFGNPLVSFKRGDTIYQIAPIPLGGFVQITGLNPHEEFDRADPCVYPNRPRWMRLAVLVAGPAANYLTAVVLAFGLFLAVGKFTTTNTVDDVLKGSPAEAIGLKRGDVLLEANGQPVSANHSISVVVRESKGAPVTVKLRRGDQPMTFTVTPRKDQESGDFRIGIQLGQLREPVPALVAAREAVTVPVVQSGMILAGFRDMIIGKQKASLSGPVGIARELARRADQGMVEFLNLIMTLSIYLGLFNLLPFPALDGGRALFLGISALRRNEVNAKTEATVHMVGLVLLLGVFVIVTFKDIKEIVVRFVN